MRVVEATERRLAPHAASNRRAQIATVMIVESDFALRELMERYLSGEGFRVVSVASADEAADLIRQHQPAVVMLDVDDTEVDAAAAVARVRSDLIGAAIPLVVLGSGTPTPDPRKLGAEDCLGKPINWQAMAAMAKKWVRTKGAGSRDRSVAAGAGS